MLHAQLQSAAGHLSDEQQSAPQAQSQHPEFPQLQPIASMHAKEEKKAISFFIKLYSPMYYITLFKQLRQKKAPHNPCDAISV